MRLLTLVWGLAALVEATLGIAAAFLLPAGSALSSNRFSGLAQ